MTQVEAAPVNTKAHPADVKRAAEKVAAEKAATLIAAPMAAAGMTHQTTAPVAAKVTEQR